MAKFRVISPDGIIINDNKYDSAQEAIDAFTKWAKQYQKQGYYSSNNGRIPLNELEEHCTIEQI